MSERDLMKERELVKKEASRLGLLGNYFAVVDDSGKVFFHKDSIHERDFKGGELHFIQRELK